MKKVAYTTIEQTSTEQTYNKKIEPHRLNIRKTDNMTKTHAHHHTHARTHAHAHARTYPRGRGYPGVFAGAAATLVLTLDAVWSRYARNVSGVPPRRAFVMVL